MKTGWIIVWSIIGIVLVFVLVIALLVALIPSGTSSASSPSFSFGKASVAKIYIQGEIVGDDGGTLFAEQLASSTQIREQLKSAAEDPSISAILLEINSPGGSAVASREIADVVAQLEKPTVAVIREVGASGGYWIASATDYVVADELSITGSIGVLASSLNLAGLLDDYNVTYEQLNGGKYKDIGTPLRKMTDEERILLESKIQIIHDVFIREVAANRELSFAEVNASATGIFYLGSEAKDLGLVDELGNEKTAVTYLASVLGVSDEDISFIEYRVQPSFFDLLYGAISNFGFQVGKGISSGLSEAGVSVRV